MNLISHLQFGDNSSGIYHREYLLLGARTHVRRNDDSFHPDSTPHCDVMEVSVVASDTDDLFFIEWFQNDSVHSGRITFDLDQIESEGGETSIRSVEFYNARCHGFRECFDVQSGKERIFQLKLFPSRCVIGRTAFNNSNSDKFN